MEKSRLLSCTRYLLLLVLFLAALQPVKAERGAPTGPRHPGRVRLKIPNGDVPERVCVGQELTIEYLFKYELPPRTAPPLVPPGATVTASAQKGTATPASASFSFKGAWMNTWHKGRVVYQAERAGNEALEINVTMLGRTGGQIIPFKVRECQTSIQWNEERTFSAEMVSLITYYSGSGSLSVDDDGQISGRGVQMIQGNIPPYSSEEGSCQLTSPWEGSSAITFSGQAGDGEADVTMELAALQVSAATLTCWDEEYRASMTFPAYTYASCQIQLTGFDFEGTTLDVLFDCPGEDPITIPITIIPRSGS